MVYPLGEILDPRYAHHEEKFLTTKLQWHDSARPREI